jgi:hypothetical protein
VANFFQHLLEVGRALSSKNEAKIRTASDALNEVLGDLGELSEADRSLHQRLATIEQAVHVRFSNDMQYAYISDIYDAMVVVAICTRTDGYRSESTLYQMPYTLNADDTVSFGDAVQVVRRVVYEPVATTDMEESALTSEPVDLIERGLRSDGTGRIKIIAPGWGSSGYYGADVLKRDGPKVFTSGMHMYVDHPTQTERRDIPERSVERLAAVTTSDATWEESGSAGPGLYADVKVGQTYREHINDLADHIGVSIIARGNAEMGEAEGRKGLIVKSINQADSIDFVTRAGAGGAILPLIEARRNNPILSTKDEPDMSKELLERLDKLEAENKQLRAAQLQAQAVAVIQEALVSHNLPANVSQRVAASIRFDLPENGVLDVAALKESVKAAVDTELVYIESLKIPAANLREAGQPRGVGGTAPVTHTISLTEAFEGFGLNAEAAKIAASK